jgi:flagellum-specific ATP synthase
MVDAALEGLAARIAAITAGGRRGRISGASGATLTASGLGDAVALGDRVRVTGARADLSAEVLRVSPEGTVLLPEEVAEGVAVGDAVDVIGPVSLAPDDSWIGRILDPYGLPLDDRPILPGAEARPLRASPPPATRRGRLGARLETGMAVFDTLLPLVAGQRIGLFAGSGVGKSSLLARFARDLEADVVVLALIGERGREVREFVERVLGPAGMARTVVIAATSDRSPLVRRRAAFAAMAVAEHFRDDGRRVLFLADSVTRFAEAHREVALAAGETAAMRGHPPSLSQAIMGLAERAGPGLPGQGAITAIFSVLVAGSDMEEPVADILRGVLDGHVVLDRKIAERGRFPAVDLLRSVSRSLPEAALSEENALIAETRQVLGAWDRAEMMVQAGLYAAGSDAAVDRAIRLWPALDAFLAENAPHEGRAGSFARLGAILAGEGR